MTGSVLDPPRPAFPAARVLTLAGGILLVVGIFLAWYVSSAAAGTRSFRGLDLGVFTPEVFALPAIGLALVVGSLTQWRSARSAPASRLPTWGAILLGGVALLVCLEAAIRFDSTALGLFGAGFWNAAGVGWYVSVGGGAMVLGAGLLRVVPPSAGESGRGRAPR